MASDYQAISAYNEEQLGKDRASRKSQVAMYTDPVHFIFELLQNADDACATKISFTVAPDQLIIEHNGKPFTESNVKAISYFEKSDKTESGEEITKIGHFGLGFKSVFAYTASPHVYSAQESFKITQLYSVEVVPYPNDLREAQTRFVLPFDHLSEKPDYIENRKLKSPEDAYQDIARKLTTLGADTLLFTKYLQEIEWTSQNDTRHYRRDTTSIKEQIREICINNGASEQRCYLVFDRPIYWPDENEIEKQHRPVQIAFGLDKPRKNDGVIRKINKARLFVFFPTAKETHVGFILQGPYRTTPPRENVFPDDEFNQHLVNQTAELLTESLHQLKELDLLNLDTLSILPLDKEKFGEGLFEPLYSKIREAFKTSQLIPKHGGGFTSANESKLARGAKLAEVFDTEQLGELFSREKLEWLDTILTKDNYPDLHEFLSELGIEVSPDTLAPKLTTDFFSKQSPEWLIKFIQYAEKSTDRIKQCPFIRLESGEQVALPETSTESESKLWIAPDQIENMDLSAFPLVHADLAADETVRAFLEKEGIFKITSIDIVEKCILPKYQDTPFEASKLFRKYQETYRADLQLIGKAYADADDETKERLNVSLNEIEWLACIHASDKEADKVVWQTPESANLYAKPDEELGFLLPENHTTYFLHPVVSEALAEFKSINNYLNESILTIAPLTIVKDFILSNYKPSLAFDEISYRKDLGWICKAFSGDDSVKTQLKQSLNSSTWLACIHASGKEPKKIIWKKPKSDDLFANPGDEQMFRVPEDMNGYFLHPSVTEEFSQNESARSYLETCLNKMDSVAIVEKFILPKYNSQKESTEFDETDYRSDLQWICKAYNSNKNQISNKLISSAWLACVHASGQKPEQIFWKRPNAEEEGPRHHSYSPYQSYSQALQDYEVWKKTSNLFKQTDDHSVWFADLKDVKAYFLHSSVSEELAQVGIIDNLINPIRKLTKDLPDSDSTPIDLQANQVPIEYRDNHMQRGDKYFQCLNGFNPNVSIYGLEQAFKTRSIDKFRVLWGLLLQSPRIISGKIRSGTNNRRLYNEKSWPVDSNVGKLCRKYEWLPDKEGNWHPPSELLLTDLPEEFDTDTLYAKDIAEKLGMKKPEVEQALELITGGDKNLEMLIESYKTGSEADRQKMLKIIPQEIPPQPAPSFKDGLNSLNRSQRGVITPTNTDNQSYSINNPTRYQKKVNQSVEEGIKIHESTPQTIRFSPVRESPSNKSARQFLYQQYQGQCQITGNTFPKSSANAAGEAENYFEACSLLSYSNAEYLNDAGNMLCVSADTLAKLKNARFEWLEPLETIIENYKKNRETGEIDNVKVKIQLAGDECVITWNKRHFDHLLALWDEA